MTDIRAWILAGSLEERQICFGHLKDAMTRLDFESTIQHLLNKEIIILTTDSVLRGVNLESAELLQMNVKTVI